jgi:hypothetical protein
VRRYSVPLRLLGPSMAPEETSFIVTAMAQTLVLAYRRHSLSFVRAKLPMRAKNDGQDGRLESGVVSAMWGG